MDLIEAKIAEIKNLNLIYIFTTDNILKNKTKEVNLKININDGYVVVSTVEFNNNIKEGYLTKIEFYIQKIKSHDIIDLITKFNEKGVQRDENYYVRRSWSRKRYTGRKDL
mgnify:CR=1 FL=1